MEVFELDLADGGKISGRCSFPQAINPPRFTPLMICMHGGSYDSGYFDVEARYSILNFSTSIGIPVISLDRPGYGASKVVPVIGDNATYAEAQGRYINNVILPSLWNSFAKRTGATAIVLMAHSIGGMMATIAAGSHSRDDQYPLAGLIVSGIGSKLVEGPQAAMIQLLANDETFVNFDARSKDAIMLQWPPKNLVGPEICQHTAKLNKPVPRGELYDINTTWLNRWEKHAGAVTVPVMHALGEYDGLWVSTKEATADYKKAFPRSPSVQSDIVPMAPHCIELSFQSNAWYLKCCGFAFECAVSYGLRN